MVDSAKIGSYVQQVTEAYRNATQSDRTGIEIDHNADNRAQPVTPAAPPPLQHNTGLKGEEPEDTNTPRGAYLDITA